MYFSADPDARWVKKRAKSTLGYKAFARTDEEGFVGHVHTTPANKSESPEFGTMINGAKAQRVLAPSCLTRSQALMRCWSHCPARHL